ncbi:hypothetical protein J2S59_001021 [Nocardioides massiliensis]|uniref:Tissue inhibitor of metalloproteinase n=2 Tax=Nocardioides massiliensis TaxID=1325935 RepID=A0ABT9NLB2_9ACTN|nr:hypothetical protein [Nocardioides massiliensis]MDP9821212.1 hypothetical protein [Nocardioides massiliensis]
MRWQPPGRGRRLTSMSLLVRLVARLCLVASFALAPLLLVAAPAHACSCAQVAPEEHRERADVVVVGELLDVEHGNRQTLLQVGVEGVEKGESGRVLRLLTAGDGAACGLDFVTVGERYRFYATENAEGILEAGLCGGTTGIGTTPVDPEVAKPPTATGERAYESFAEFSADSARPRLPASGNRLGLAEGAAMVAAATLGAGAFAWWLRRRRTRNG